MPLALALHVFVLLFVLVAVLADHAAHARHVCVMAKPFGLGLGNTRIAMSFWSRHAVEQACSEEKERRAWCRHDVRLVSVKVAGRRHEHFRFFDSVTTYFNARFVASLITLFTVLSNTSIPAPSPTSSAFAFAFPSISK